MATIRAAVLPAPGAPVEVRDLPRPDAEPGGALMRVVLSEVCGTDVHLRDGRLAGVPYPIIPGHVSVGQIVEAGADLTDVQGRPVAVGDTVTFLDVHETCHACWFCTVARATTRCPHRKVYGITYGVEDGLTGGWAEMLALKPGVKVIPLSVGAAERFMAGGCGLPTSLHAVERAGILPGDSVLVLGSGPVGLSLVILANLVGATTVLCVGGPEPRLAAAHRAGAHDTLDFTTRDRDARAAWVRERTGGRGADVVFEATGAPAAVTDAMVFAREAGRVVVVGQYTDHGETAFNPHTHLNQKHLDVRGCWGSDYSHFHRAALLMEDARRARAWTDAISTERYGLSQMNEALRAVEEGLVVKALVDPSLA
ncbi:MAG: alcohol dehydrogenase [Planctomycetota bacterium]|nr:MAG: alcohol dehydrogenase [Planctomycetota bacterium]